MKSSKIIMVVVLIVTLCTLSPVFANSSIGLLPEVQALINEYEVKASADTAVIAVGPVTLNGQTIDNELAKYPLLLYKNITYFPMTYNLCRFLGVETNWDNSTRTLSIDKSNIKTDYVADVGANNKKGRAVTLKTVNYPVIVNGVSVENYDSTWPLLNYNDITYFPLTWQFAVDSFGWDYQWDAVNGLRINSKTTTPDEEIHTNNKKLDIALNILSSHYSKNRSYSGILNGSDVKASKSFLAEVNCNKSTNNLVVQLSANPFVFFRNGVGVSSTYVGGSLSSDALISISSLGGMLQAEEAMADFEKTEQGYLSRCFIDFQFSGLRTGKIKDYKMVSQNNDTVIWRLSVENMSGDFVGYEAELVVNMKLSTVESIKIETKNYSLLMIPVK